MHQCAQFQLSGRAPRTIAGRAGASARPNLTKMLQGCTIVRTGLVPRFTPKSSTIEIEKEAMRVLVTGGAGYIGSHTCLELLNSGHE